MLHQQVKMEKQQHPGQETVEAYQRQRHVEQGQGDGGDAEDLLGIGAGNDEVDVKQQR